MKWGPRGSIILTLKGKNWKDLPFFSAMGFLRVLFWLWAGAMNFLHHCRAWGDTDLVQQLQVSSSFAAACFCNCSIAEQSPLASVTHERIWNWVKERWYKTCHFMLCHQHKGFSSYNWLSLDVASKHTSPHPAPVSTQEQSSKPTQVWDHTLPVADNRKPGVSSENPSIALLGCRRSPTVAHSILTPVPFSSSN